MDQLDQCDTCDQFSVDSTGQCLNPSCVEGARAATEDAVRDTAKATARFAGNRPAAFSSSGRVD